MAQACQNIFVAWMDKILYCELQQEKVGVAETPYRQHQQGRRPRRYHERQTTDCVVSQDHTKQQHIRNIITGYNINFMNASISKNTVTKYPKRKCTLPQKHRNKISWEISWVPVSLFRSWWPQRVSTKEAVLLKYIYSIGVISWVPEGLSKNTDHGGAPTHQNIDWWYIQLHLHKVSIWLSSKSQYGKIEQSSENPHITDGYSIPLCKLPVMLLQHSRCWRSWWRVIWPFTWVLHYQKPPFGGSSTRVHSNMYTCQHWCVRHHLRLAFLNQSWNGKLVSIYYFCQTGILGIIYRY